ncbi:hypothetical protein KIV45_16000 [Janthinobacterium lividum]|nr:hypothetical protein KIV45_16000 [Janthinobacterium lividum]
MPAIPNELLDCVLYLYPDSSSAIAGVRYGGAAFIVGVQSKTNQTVKHLYAITNHHVAVKSGYSVIRFNKKDGGAGTLDLDPSDWEFSAEKGDVCIASLSGIGDNHRFNFVPNDLFLTEAEQNSRFIGVGDDVFMVGRFIDHDGGQTNSPAVRFGNISIAPSYLPDINNSGKPVHYYCLDMHSRTGFSGSPVFAYRTPGADLNDAFSQNLRMRPPVLRLLGIHCGQFPEDMWLKGDNPDDETSRPIVGYSGMTFALPAWKIQELLELDKFVTQRAKEDALLKTVNFAQQRY